MNEELKPCPFCGHEVVVQSDENNEFYICCTGCYTLHGYCTDTWGEFTTEAEAIRSWNTRAKLPIQYCIFTFNEDLHFWQCSECEREIYLSIDRPNSLKDNGYRYCPSCGRKIAKEIRNYE